jgi:ElaB/YqjD/DUF883 family membrane-anchored ribosome-binding protein
MSERVKIFEPCELTYSQYEKPVRYTEEFLKQIASRTIGTKIVDEHYGKTIGNMTNFTFTDGALFVDASSSQSLQKFSPSFDNLTLVDEGDYFVATDGTIVEVASTVKPRLDNSDDGGSNMSEETIKVLNQQVKDLNKQLAIAENKNKANEEKLAKFDEMEQELSKLREANEANSKLLEEQKPIVEKFNEIEEKRHEELLDIVSRGNPELKEAYKDFKTEDLQTIANTYIEDQPPKGVGAENAPGLDEGTGEEDEVDDFDIALETFKKNHNGEIPSFLKQLGGE